MSAEKAVDPTNNLPESCVALLPGDGDPRTEVQMDGQPYGQPESNACGQSYHWHKGVKI